MTWPSVTRDDLKRWADSAGADLDLPRLVRRLIAETGEGVQLRDVPGGSGVATGGFDGFVRAERATEFVPAGASVWEMSVDKNAQRKADEDIAKRLTVPDGSPTTDAAYVEVICRPWTKHRAWTTEWSDKGTWREVRAYNLDRLDTWLESAPATTVWLAGLLGLPIDGVRTGDDWWRWWLDSTATPLGADLIIAGREAEAETIDKRLTAGAGVTTVGGEVRAEEIAAFLAAVAERRAAAGAPAIQAKLLFVDDRSTFRQLLRLGQPLILAVPGSAYVDDLMPGTPHHVVVPVPGSDHGDVVLPPVDAKRATDVLRDSGVDWDAAWEFGRLARRSLLALRRRVARRPELHRPAWSVPGADGFLRRVLLLNEWNQTRPGDREAVVRVFGRDYDQVEDQLVALATSGVDPLLAVTDGRWHVISPADSWLLLGPQVRSSDLDRFREITLDVLGEKDPVLELAPEARWRASMDGIRRTYSSTLRRGLARSLALLGAFDNVVRTEGGRAGADWAARIVHELLAAANSDESFHLWTSLGDVLPLLAEAAPEQFLEALDRALETSPPLLARMFTDAERDEFGHPPASPHTHFLWALERLAWSVDHFPHAVRIIARLAELDPGGQWSNRPQNSVEQIFFARRPLTSASVDQRLAELDRLRTYAPEVGWKLLLSMLPDAHAVQMLGRGPDYRAWKTGEPVVSPDDYRRTVTRAAELLLGEAGDSASRHLDLLGQGAKLAPEHRRRLCESLRRLASDLTATERQAAWEAVRNLIARHREFADAKWALGDEALEPFEALEADLRPQAPHERHAWLFAESFVELGDVSRRDDFAAYDAEVSDRRRDAVAEIYHDSGLDGVLAFARVHQATAGIIGASLARAAAPSVGDTLLPMLDNDDLPSVNVAFGYYGQRFRDMGWPEFERLLREPPDKQTPLGTARLLRSANDAQGERTRIDGLGQYVAAAYWREFNYFGLGHDFPDAVEVATQLMSVGRFAAALDLLALYGRKEVDEDYASAVAVGFEGIMAADVPDPGLAHLSSHNLDTLLAILSAHSALLGPARIARIEWYFLPALGFEPNAPTLHRTLTDDPEFFVEMVKLVFRPASRAKPDREASEQDRRVAEQAFHLLNSWTTCPGTTADGALDEASLMSWIERARSLLASADRQAIGDQQIGQALAAAPADSDGTYPPLPVRQALERFQNRNIDLGLEIRIYNNRGVTSRDPEAGGAQERGLAANYRQQAARVAIEWPRTAAILRKLADTYEAEARREDDEAEQLRRGLD